MSDVEVLPEIKQILGALLFASKDPLSSSEMKKVIKEVAEKKGGTYKDYAEVTDGDVKSALGQLKQDLEQARLGVHLIEVAKGYQLQNDVNCGLWLRHMLDRGRANRLTKPALETLAIIAYRQPVTRAEIEAVRGVAVDQILRNLIELQLIRIAGRSELPGKPWMFGTTHKFLEYFGLRDVKDLPSVEELRRVESENKKKAKNEAIEPATEAAPDEDEEEKARLEEALADPKPEEAGDEAEAESAPEAKDGEADDDADDEEYDDDEFEDDDDDEDDDEEEEEGDDEEEGDK